MYTLPHTRTHTHLTSSCRVLTALALVALHVATVAPAAAQGTAPLNTAAQIDRTPDTPKGLQCVPAELDLAGCEPGKTLTRDVWLINHGDTAIEILKAKGSCGCTTLDFQPQTLLPCSSLKVPVRIAAPKGEGATKKVRLTFTFGDGKPLTMPIRIETTGESARRKHAVSVEPQAMDLGTVTAGEVVTQTVRVVNDGDTPRTIRTISAGCRCLRAPDFETMTLPAHEFADVTIEATAPETIGPATPKELLVVVEKHPVVKVPVRMHTTHPAVATVRAALESAFGSRHHYRDFEIKDGLVTAIAWSRQHQPVGRVTVELGDDGEAVAPQFVALTAVTEDM